MSNRATTSVASCPRSRHEALLYAAGELPSRERASYERHLAFCAECRAVVDVQHAVGEGYAKSVSRGPGTETLRTLSAAARRSAEARRAATPVLRLLDRLRPRRVGRDPAPVLGWALAASILLVAVVLPFGGWTADETLPQAAIAWRYDVELESTTAVAGQTDLNDESVPAFTWIEDSDDTFSDDLVALADDIDTFTTQIYDF